MMQQHCLTRSAAKQAKQPGSHGLSCDSTRLSDFRASGTEKSVAAHATENYDSGLD